MEGQHSLLNIHTTFTNSIPSHPTHKPRDAPMNQQDILVIDDDDYETKLIDYSYNYDPHGNLFSHLHIYRSAAKWDTEEITGEYRCELVGIEGD